MGLSTLVTVPPAIPGSVYPVIVYNEQLPASNASAAAKTLFTVPSSGTYRVTVQGSLTAVGTAGATQTMAWNLIFQDPLAAAAKTVATVGTFTTDTGNSNNGVVGYLALTSGTNSYIFRALAGSALQISTTASGGATYPAVQLLIVVECLGT